MTEPVYMTGLCYITVRLKILCACSLPDAGTSNPAATSAGPSTGSPLTQSVVVENPPSLDKDGNEVRNCPLRVVQSLLYFLRPC